MRAEHSAGRRRSEAVSVSTRVAPLPARRGQGDRGVERTVVIGTGADVTAGAPSASEAGHREA